MLIEEADWFAEQLESLEPICVFPMCNIGSSTKDFRSKEQPWIDERIFEPILRQGNIVKHLDIKPAIGVDIIGDLADPTFFFSLSQMHFKSVFCSNFLEHVLNREEICRALLDMISSGGYLFISVPQFYPYHPDPIDTGYRPSILELAALFPGTCLVKSCVVTGSTLLGIRRRNPVVFIYTLLRFLFPMYKPVSWWRNRGYLPYFFRRLMVTCVVLQKE